MISKKDFCKTIEHMKKVSQFRDDVAALCNKYYCGDLWDTPDLQDACCHLLNLLFGLEENPYGTDLEYFIYDLEYGTKWNHDSIADKDGNPIDWSTPEKFYDWIIQNGDTKNE